MAIRLPTRQRILVLILSITTLATAQQVTRVATQGSAPLLPACLLPCIGTKLSSFPDCSSGTDLGCLCEATSSEGKTFGEEAVLCLFLSPDCTSALAQGSSIPNRVYSVCAGHPGAAPQTNRDLSETYQALTTTAVLGANGRTQEITTQVGYTQVITIPNNAPSPTATADALATAAAISTSSTITSTSTTTLSIPSSSAPGAQTVMSSQTAVTPPASVPTLNSGQIAGIAAGGIGVALTAVAALIYILLTRRRKQSRSAKDRSYRSIKHHRADDEKSLTSLGPLGHSLLYYPPLPKEPIQTNSSSTWFRRSPRPGNIGLAISPSELEGSPVHTGLAPSYRTMSTLLPPKAEYRPPPPLPTYQRPQSTATVFQEDAELEGSPVVGGNGYGYNSHQTTPSKQLQRSAGPLNYSQAPQVPPKDPYYDPTAYHSRNTSANSNISATPTIPPRIGLPANVNPLWKGPGTIGLPQARPIAAAMNSQHSRKPSPPAIFVPTVPQVPEVPQERPREQSRLTPSNRTATSSAYTGRDSNSTYHMSPSAPNLPYPVVSPYVAYSPAVSRRSHRESNVRQSIASAVTDFEGMDSDWDGEDLTPVQESPKSPNSPVEYPRICGGSSFSRKNTTSRRGEQVAQIGHMRKGSLLEKRMGESKAAALRLEKLEKQNAWKTPLSPDWQPELTPERRGGELFLAVH